MLESPKVDTSFAIMLQQHRQGSALTELGQALRTVMDAALMTGKPGGITLKIAIAPTNSGTVVDATNIAAPSSTKNKDGERDPEMHQTRKGKQWRVSRTQAEDLWCCTEDGSRPPEAGLQEQASNHPVLLRSKGAVVSDRAKVIP